MNNQNGGQPSYRPTLPPKAVYLNEPKCYWSSQEAVRMHRWDGGEITFVYHYFESNLQYDIDYLDHEIENGSHAVRHATEQEIKDARFRMNPKAELRKELADDPEFIEQLRQKWESERNGENKLAGVNASSQTGNEVKVEGATIALEAKSNENPPRKTPAEIAADIAAKRDLGKSTEPKLTPVSTADIAQGGAGPSVAGTAGK